MFIIIIFFNYYYFFTLGIYVPEGVYFIIIIIFLNTPSSKDPRG